MIKFYSTKTCDTFATIANHAKGTFEISLKKYPNLSVSLVRNNKPKFVNTLSYNIEIETYYKHCEPDTNVLGLITLKPDMDTSLSHLTINDTNFIKLTQGLDIINHYYNYLLNPKKAIHEVPKGHIVEV